MQVRVVYMVIQKNLYKETDQVNHPLQLYAATKRSNELIAHSYSSLFNLPTTGMRFLQYMELGEDRICQFLCL